MLSLVMVTCDTTTYQFV